MIAPQSPGDGRFACLLNEVLCVKHSIIFFVDFNARDQGGYDPEPKNNGKILLLSHHNNITEYCNEFGIQVFEKHIYNKILKKYFMC